MDGLAGPFVSVPLVFHDHHLPITDLSWSINGFLLTSSMDKTVKLYHMDYQTCLCTFSHPDCVSSVCFHPTDDQYFITGCLDGRVRVWSIQSKKVVWWHQLKVSVTAVGFTKDGATVIAGTLAGTCIFYDFNGLKYNTQIQLAHSKGFKSKDCRVTGIETIPSLSVEEKLLISTTDSRIRLINVRDKSIDRKYKGIELKSLKGFARFSQSGQFIISGSEDKQVFIWETLARETNQHSKPWQSDNKAGGYQKFMASIDPITNALFAPWPTSNQDLLLNNQALGAILVVSDLSGIVRVFENFEVVDLNPITTELKASPQVMDE